MSDINWYVQYCPVLREEGWYETGATGFGLVHFCNVIHREPDFQISVGIVILPNNWRYCAKINTAGSSCGVNVSAPVNSTPWNEVKEYYLNHGIRAAHEDREQRQKALMLQIELEDERKRMRNEEM